MIHAREDYNRIQDPEEKIAEDEPVFLIRAKDAVAPATLRMWAELHTVNGGDPLLSQMACEHAEAMKEWQAINGCKAADLQPSK